MRDATSFSATEWLALGEGSARTVFLGTPEQIRAGGRTAHKSDSVGIVETVTDFKGQTFRFAPLQPVALVERILRDQQRVQTPLELTFGLAMSCLDQVDAVRLSDGSTWPVQEASLNLARRLKAGTVLESHGPSRATMNLLLCSSDHTP
jgi:hypothetical protein